MVTWGRMPLPSAHGIEWTLSRLLPPPGRDRSPGAPDGKAPHYDGDLGAECRMRAGLGPAPTEGRAESWPRPVSLGPLGRFTSSRPTDGERWGGPVQAPLKRGLSPPSGGDWGFLVSCRRRGAGRGKKPSVTASPCRLPFQGRFLGGWWAVKDTDPCIWGSFAWGATTRRAPRIGSRILQSHPPEPMARRAEDTGETIKRKTSAPHPLSGSLVTFWPSRKSLAPQGETPRPATARGQNRPVRRARPHHCHGPQRTTDHKFWREQV